MSDTGITNIRGKEYQTVAVRVTKFREAFPNYALPSSVVLRDEECVVMQAMIADDAGRVLATGHAEEYRKASQINKTSALENCETSAIGRALAAFGFGGTEFATANEVVNAIHQQNTPANDSPPKARKLEGPHTSPTALKKAVHEADRNIRGCGDSAELEAYLTTPEFVALSTQLKRDAVHYLKGGPELPEEFEPLYDLVKRMKRDFEDLENQGDNDVRHAMEGKA